MTPHGQKKIDDPTQRDMAEDYNVVLMSHIADYRRHLQNMLAIIAENREVLKIENGSPLDKEIRAARKFMVEHNGDASVEHTA
jgi:hypothetical protein